MKRINTRGKSFILEPNETLLEALERTGHDVEYQCKSGYCGACRLKILSGSVSYANTPLAFIQSDEILPCCCQAQTDITLDCRLRQTESAKSADLFTE
ncbi:class I ribonucleotide reductase maintenance protein YfaE [Stenoxybacter acetivorans]|uniref:class I ribonucleotide reductase maintenance protein YfaE n=1 Tax=Stenoxybacter acetivorans TaxID=422441 RepID=UPI0005628DDB|nr:class I ribonucleotide reductase maintenance protein YfaE [Stenoxybacter acetivorans]